MSTEKCQTKPANNQSGFFDNQRNEYDVAPGTSDYGGEYEFKMCALIALHLYFDQDVVNFKISNNVKNFGKFDDIVLEVTHKNNENQNILIQSKYLDRTDSRITRSDFKPNKGYFDILKYNPPKHLIEGLENVKYLLFTNGIADLDSINRYVEEIGPYEMNAIIETNPGDIFNKICCTEGKLLKFNIMSTNETKLKTEHYGFETFIENLYFCTDQYSIKQLNSQLQKIIKDHFEQIDGLEMMEGFCKFFELWWRKSTKRPKLQRADISLKLGTMILTQYVPQQTEEKIQNENVVHVNLLRQAVMMYDISLCYPYSNIILNVWTADIREIRKCYERRDFLNLSHTSDENLPLKEKALILWIHNKAALVLHFGNDNWSTVKRGIQMCREYNQSFRFVLCAPLERLSIPVGFGKILENLGDLKNYYDLREEIITCFKLRPDNRGLFSIKEVFGSDLSNLKTITIGDCVSMAEKERVTKDNANPIPNYIQRAFSRLIPAQGVEDIEDNIIIVGCRNKWSRSTRRKEMSLTDFLSMPALDKIENIIITTKDSINDFTQIKEKCSSFHYFEEIDESKLEWITSYKPSTLIQMEHDNSNCIPDTEFFKHFRNDINIILADPGMGKSVLMDYLTIVCPPNFWPIKVIVRQHFTFLKDPKNIDVNLIIDYLIKEIVNVEWQKYAKQLKDNGNLIIIWDGLDEFSTKCLDNLMEIISTLREHKFKQIVTSRNLLKEKLEGKMKIRHLTMLPFNEKAQIQFIEKSLDQTSYTEDEKIKIKKVIVDSIGIKRYREILGIPLQLYLYVQVYISESVDKQVDVNNLAIIYEQFINSKIKIAFKKKELNDAETFNKEEVFKEKELIKYQKAAIISHFDDNLCQTFKKELAEFFEDIRRGNFEKGIIISSTDEDKPMFFHETMAEYLVALYLKTNWQNADKRVKSFIKNVFSNWFIPKFETIRYFFDLLLAQDHPLHIYCLNQDYDKILQNEVDFDWSECDDGNRSVLHLICSTGQKHPDLEKNERNEYVINQFKLECDKCYEEVVKHAIEKCDVLLKDNILKMTCLKYALKTKSLFEIESILRKNNCQVIKFKSLQEKQYRDYLMYYSVKCNYYEILNRIKFSNIKFFKGFSLLHLASSNGQQNAVDYLLKKRVDINQTDFEGRTPLHAAAIEGHYNVIFSLIKNGANFNKCSNNGLGILHQACRGGNLESVKFLVAIGANVNHCDKNRQSILHSACYHGNLEIVKFLVEIGVDINLRDNYGQSILHLASKRGNLEIVKFLVERGADINQCDRDGQNILHWASRESGNLEMVKFLVGRGANVNECDNHQQSILHSACSHGNLEIVKFLIERGADVNVLDKFRQSTLHFACERGNLEMVKLLVERGADVNQCDQLGWSILHMVTRSGNLEIFKFLVERGTDVDYCNSNVESILHGASKNGNLEIVKFLVNLGADVNQPDILHSACALKGGNLEIVKFLVQNGADVNKCNHEGQSILHLACVGGNLEMAKFLVECGIDVNSCDESGWSILHSACVSGNLEMVKFLLERGANANQCNKRGTSVVNVAEQYGHLEIVRFLK